jgi:hypothetical protein
MSRQKRKRTVTSYAELDQLPDLLSDDDDIATVSHDESSDDDSDNDDRTYSKNKVCSESIRRESFDSLTDPRKRPKRPQRRRRRSMLLLARKPRNLSRSWSYLPNYEM